MYALVDCNNFFVSCERVFQPELEGKAVIVLSNNDGCAVARSNEAKALGIKMGTPFFQLRHLVESGKLQVRSSNYKLYGDMSERVMSLLRASAPKIEVYSIDEAFLHLQEIKAEDRKPLCIELRRKVRQWTGIPVSIGIAPTKTLCKIAGHFAKYYPAYGGVCVIDNDQKRRKALELTEIGEVWGIGRKSAPKMASLGIRTAADLAAKPEEWVKRHLNIIGIRTWQELNGIASIAEEDNSRRQSICTSRSFAGEISDKAELELRISDFAGACARKLRKENSAASRVGCFIYTNRFRPDLPQYNSWEEVILETPVNSNQEVVSAALDAFRKIYREGFGYKKAGVVVDEIVAADAVQESLFSSEEDISNRIKAEKVSSIMDKFNSDGRQILHLGTQRSGHYAEGIRREHCSRLYSTDWSELLEIH